MFLSSAARYSHPLSHPNFVKMATRWRKPVPEVVGLGMMISPLYCGLARSAHDLGVSRFRLRSSAGFTAMAPT